jgi:hypothetical protein
LLYTFNPSRSCVAVRPRTDLSDAVLQVKIAAHRLRNSAEITFAEPFKNVSSFARSRWSESLSPLIVRLWKIFRKPLISGIFFRVAVHTEPVIRVSWR